MIGSMEEALLLVQQVFADAAAGVRQGAGSAAVSAEDELAGLVLASQRVLNAASAVQAVALAGVAARDEVPGPDGSWVGVDRGVGHVGEFAAVTVAPMLGLTSRGAEERVQTAAALVSRLPGTLAAMAAGELDSWRASIIVAETGETTPAGCARVEAVILPKVCSETGGRGPGPARGGPGAGGPPAGGGGGGPGPRGGPGGGVGPPPGGGPGGGGGVAAPPAARVQGP